jgi:RNA polymerase-binding transcription factor DksA
MSKKPNKKAAAKPAKKVTKPAAKKQDKKTGKPVAKKTTKPVAKKVSKPAPKKAVKPAKVKVVVKTKNKPTSKAKPAAAKPKNIKAEVKKIAKKEVKKPVSKKEEETKLKKKATAVAPPKKEKPVSKKAGKKKSKKSDDVDLDGEELDVDAGLLEIDPDAMAIEDDDDEVVVVEEKKEKSKSRRRSRGGRIGMKKQYDSEEFVRKQVIKIDLTKALIKKPKKEEPKPFINNKDTRSRYNDKELSEFKEIIVTKLNEAKGDYDLLKQTLTNTDNHGTDDTSPTFKLLEDGSDMLSKEEVAQLASRQEKYIVSLQNALVRIQNKTYGICRVTGKLIPKERLRSVPHATLSMDAKLNQYDN